MLSGVLKSSRAIEINIEIMRAFVSMRKFISKNVDFFHRINRIELKRLESDNNFEKIFNALQTEVPKLTNLKIKH